MLALLAAVDASRWADALAPIAHDVAWLESKLPGSVIASGDRMRIDDLRRTLEAQAVKLATSWLMTELTESIDATGIGWIAPEDPSIDVPSLTPRVRQWLTAIRARGDGVVVVPVVAGPVGVHDGEPAIGADAPREAALRTLSSDGGPVPIGGRSHEDVTSFLREIASGDNGMLRFAFPDGSISGPCCLGILSDGDPPAAPPDLVFGLMSGRHLELDRQCDGFVFRNTILSDGSTMSRTEHAAYEIATEFLSEVRALGDKRIALLSTGFLPATVGWWRAVLDVLAAAEDRLIVEPRFWRGGAVFKPGRAWWSGR